MKPALTNDQRCAWVAGGGEPLPLIDQQTQETYYLVSAAQMQAVQAMFELGEFEPAELYPLIGPAAAAAGWADPEMDIYDDYDANRQ